MTDDLVAYLLNDLAPEQRAEVEAKLETDVVWRWELERLRECMAANGDLQKSVEEPPLDLVQKTCCFVEDSASGKFALEEAAKKKACRKSRAALSVVAAGEASGRSWSAADVTIGVGVLLVLAALVMPAIQQSQAAARRGTCEYNLRGLGAATAQYAELNDYRLPAVLPGQPAGLFLVGLVEGGALSKEEALEAATCPDSPLAQRRFDEGLRRQMPERAELELVRGFAMQEVLDMMGLTYAVPVGYFDAKGSHQVPRFTGGQELPLMADAPLISAAGLRPESHGGCSQVVLSEAGCVRPYSVCVLGGEDARMKSIHLNDAGVPAAGNSPDDLFLAPPNFGPDGLLAVGPPQTRKVQVFILMKKQARNE